LSSKDKNIKITTKILINYIINSVLNYYSLEKLRDNYLRNNSSYFFLYLKVLL
jgi:hypothetical protein